MARKTTRLYYGLHPETKEPLYWTLKVTNATQSVKLDGTIQHAMTAGAGVSIGCHLSNVAQSNQKKFPHPALYVSFTKSVALVITKITNGNPSHCVRYRHKYSKFVNLNDDRLTQKVVNENPDYFERQFTLNPYRESKVHWRPEYGRRETGKRAEFQMQRGELARLKRAGLIHLPLNQA